MMRFEVWHWPTNELLRSFSTEESAYTYIRELLGCQWEKGAINSIGLVDKGGETLTYPLEGAPLLAKAFGLEEE